MVKVLGTRMLRGGGALLAALALAIGPLLAPTMTAGATSPPPQLVSTTADGELGDNDSSLQATPQISSDGRYVAFRTLATNIATDGGQFSGSRIYVKDLQTGEIQDASTNSSGATFNRLTYNGVLSGDGRHVALATAAYNVDPTAPGGPNVNVVSIYVKNLDTGETKRASVDAAGTGPVNNLNTARFAISDDGNLVAMGTVDGNTYVKDMATGALTIPVTAASFVALSGSGQYLLYAKNNSLMRLDITANSTVTVAPFSNLDAFGKVANNGRVLFESVLQQTPGAADNCRDNSCNRLYLYDPLTGVITLVDTHTDGSTPLGYNGISHAFLSQDGSVATWQTTSIMRANKVTFAGGGIYSRVLDTGVTSLINVNTDLIPSDGVTQVSGSLTADGTRTVISSNPSNFGTPANCQPSGPSFAGFTFFAEDLRQCYNVYSAPTSVDELVDSTIPTLVSNDINPSYPEFTPVFTVPTAGLGGGEFYIGDTDPGLGDASPLDRIAFQPLQLYGNMGDLANAPGTYHIHFRAYSQVGNWGPTYDFTYTVHSDSIPPTFSTPVWTNNPKSLTATATLSVPVSDNDSGVASGEYFVGDVDPGQGNGATMTFDGSNLSTSFGSDFPTGVYKINVRAMDGDGNWSAPISDYLVVYDANGPKMTGKKTIVPSLDNNDVLPGLVASGQTDKATFGFSVKYNNQGQINANSDLQFTYSTGTHCNGNHAQNCHSLNFNATNIAWLTTQDTNNSTGIFQGIGTLVVDGVTTTAPFRVTGVDGTRLSSTAPDQFQIQLYATGGSPNVDTPLYMVNSANIAQGNIKIQ